MKDTKGGHPGGEPHGASSEVDLSDLRRRAEEALASGKLELAGELFAKAQLSAEELVTELSIHQAELELQAQELQAVNARLEQGLAYTRQLFESLPEPAVVVDQFGNVRASNKAARERFNLVERGARGASIRRLAADAHGWRDLTAALADAFVRGAAHLHGIAIAGPGDTPGVGNIGIFRLERSAVDSVVELLVTISDVTDVVQATRRFEAIVDSALDAIVGVDLAGVVRLFNPMAGRVFGMPSSAAIGRRIGDFFPEEVPGQSWPQIRESAADPTTVGDAPLHRLTGVRSNLERFQAEVTVSRLRGEQNGLLTLVVRDVTDRERMQRALRESEERFRQVTASISEMFWLVDVERAEFLYTSPVTASIWGFNPDARGLAMTEILARTHPDDREAVRAFFTTRHRGSRTLEHRIVWEDGTERWLSHRSSPVTQGEGAHVRVAGITADLTERREDVERIRLLEAAVANLNDAVVVMAVDPDDPVRLTTVFVNEAFQDLTGLSAEDAVGTAPESLLVAGSGDDDQAAQRRGVRDAVEARRSVRAELRLEATGARPDFRRGESPWVELELTPILAEGGVCTHFVGVMRDITERKTLESERARADRLRSLGRLTGGVAHDFNNILTIILGNADDLADNAGDPLHREMAEMIRGAAERAADLTRRLLTFARRQPISPLATDVGRLLEDFAPFLRRSLGERYTVEVTLPDAPVEAVLDPAGLESALLNLCINSRDAMGGRGRIEIEVDRVSVRDPEAPSSPGVPIGRLVPGDYVVIRVRDDGEGIPPEVLPRVFDPFFTTKGPGEGTGLGLATVYGFMTQSGGDVQVESTPGQGTTFHLFLPVDPPDDLLPGMKDWDDAEAGSLTGRRVLLVEDDPDLRRLIVRTLEQFGCDVTEVETGESALEELRQDVHIDILCCDLVRAVGMDGRELVRRARLLRGELPTVLLTGLPAAVFPADLAGDRRIGLLRKPFDARQLKAALSTLLAGKPAAGGS
jgi:PAS domain S-box-containing protein